LQRSRLDVRPLLVVLGVVAMLTPAGTAGAVVQSAATAERVSVNDNRVAAGNLDGGVATIRLEARTGEWHPDDDTDSGVVVKAFAVDGGPLQIPAPLIRVIEGTQMSVRIRNRLDEPLVVHGLFARPVTFADASGTVSIPPGESREIRFVAGTPGTYFYWAASNPNSELARRSGVDAPLSGAFIVDAKDGAAPRDRVLVATSWNGVRVIDGKNVIIRRLVINGKSWPHTERLTYDVGETVRLRVLNLGDVVHTMHLHGFYFNVDSRADERADTVCPLGSSPHAANTERLEPSRTFSLTWIPTRPGNWLFHCHDTVHIQQRRWLLDGRPMPPPAHDHVVNHALEMMSGPVVGITVRPTSTEANRSDAVVRRQLRLVARVDAGGTAAEPAYGFTLEYSGKTTPSAPPYVPGPTIVLKRGEPVSIAVDNRLPEPTAVHWHGIELESYYDGVPGFAGSPGRIAPAIPPGQSFEARFTPPRAGTFIYHSHLDEVRQQQAGLTGALLVVDDPALYDPTRDIVLLVTTPRRIADDATVLLNGTATPPAREMRVGQRYRLRLINVHVSRPNLRIRMLRDNAPLTWRAIAKDGMDLPPDQATERAAEQQVGNGETYDFEFVPTAEGENLIDVRGAGGALLASMPVHVR
jgi:FtsP/CotA-like multicopper oxidase with cupredoxin domain